MNRKRVQIVEFQSSAPFDIPAGDGGMRRRRRRSDGIALWRRFTAQLQSIRRPAVSRQISPAPPPPTAIIDRFMAGGYGDTAVAAAVAAGP